MVSQSSKYFWGPFILAVKLKYEMSHFHLYVSEIFQRSLSVKSWNMKWFPKNSKNFYGPFILALKQKCEMSYLHSYIFETFHWPLSVKSWNLKWVPQSSKYFLGPLFWLLNWNVKCLIFIYIFLKYFIDPCLWNHEMWNGFPKIFKKF